MQPVHFRRRYGNQRMQQKDYRHRHRPQHRQRGRQGSRATQYADKICKSQRVFLRLGFAFIRIYKGKTQNKKRRSAE